MSQDITKAPRPAGQGHRVALLEGAIECLQTVGYARTTARAVVAASNTNLGSIAYHFGSIEKLRDEALIEAASRWLAPIIAATEEGETAPQGLKLGLRAFLSSLPEQRPLAVAFFEALAQVGRKEGLRQRLAVAYEELRRAIAGSARPGMESSAAASLVMAIFDGLMIQWMIDPNRSDDVDRLVGELEPAFRWLV